MVEKLLFTNYSLGSKYTVDVYGIIETQKKLFLKILHDNTEIKTYRLIAWDREDQERIYVHQKTNMFIQIGHFDMRNNGNINFQSGGKIKLDWPMINLFKMIFKYMYKQNQWHDIDPVEFRQNKYNDDVVSAKSNAKSHDCPICGQSLTTVVDMGAVGSYCRKCDNTF